LTVNQVDFNLFVDIVNVFNTKYMTGGGFRNEDQDVRNYLNSLHLPIYSDQKYQDAGFTAGNDRVGDMRSASKDYIDMPDISSFAFNSPRSVILGLQFNF
jgi:hypothetical protein